MSATYKYTYNLPAYVRGNSVPSWSITVDRVGVADALVSATVEYRSSAGASLLRAACGVSGDTVTIPALADTTTSRWPVGTVKYCVTLVYSNGHTRSYVAGDLPLTSC